MLFKKQATVLWLWQARSCTIPNRRSILKKHIWKSLVMLPNCNFANSVLVIEIYFTNWSTNIWEVDLCCQTVFLDWGSSWFSVDQHDNRQAEESTRTAGTITTLASDRNVLSRKTVTCVGSASTLKTSSWVFQTNKKEFHFSQKVLRISWAEAKLASSLITSKLILRHFSNSFENKKPI